MIKLTYRIIKFTKVNKYVGVAWNYDHGILLSTYPNNTYCFAKDAIENRAKMARSVLQWFDGEYTCAGEGEPIVSLDGVEIDTGTTSLKGD